MQNLKAIMYVLCYERQGGIMIFWRKYIDTNEDLSSFVGLWSQYCNLICKADHISHKAHFYIFSWNVRDITSSCCSFVSFIKFTA